MIIIGVDFHPEFQQMASVDSDTGEFQEKRLAHREDAEKFYRALAGQEVRVGMEASGHGHWNLPSTSEIDGNSITCPVSWVQSARWLA
jgi:transposase